VCAGEYSRLYEVRIAVDREICDLHGQCVFAAPELFRFRDDGELEHEAEAGDELVAAARRAASLCPTSAIELKE
jgi:ferredoxin